MTDILRHLPVNIRSMPLMLAAICLLSGCRTAPLQETGEASVAGGLSPLPPLPVENAVHYQVDPVRTELRILVYRAGPLARLGHNHVIEVRGAAGDIYIAKDFHLSGFVLNFPVESMEVDSASARAEEGEDFDSVPSAQAIAGTRENMLGPAVLDAGSYPGIMIRSVAVGGDEGTPEITIQITLHGNTREYTVPVTVDYPGQGLAASGEMILRTSDFGLVPFSILGGGLQVQDEIEVHFRIVAGEV